MTGKFLPPTLDYRIPDISTGDDLRNIRRVIYFLNNQANTRIVADEIIGRLSLIKDENNEYVFTDMRESSPHIVLAKQLAHIGSMVNFMAANVPLLLEDYMIALMGENPIDGLPEFAWVVYRLSEPQGIDYTINRGKVLRSEKGKLYTAVYDLTIPKNSMGDEYDEQNNYLYMQLYRSNVVGSSERVAPRELKYVEGSIAYVKEIYNPDSSFGGRDTERYSDYRVRVFQAPSDKLVITGADYIREIRRFLGPSARAIVIGNDRLGERSLLNKVRVAVVDPGGEVIYPNTPPAMRLLAYLEDKDPNAETVIVAPVFTELSIEITVKIEAIARISIENTAIEIERIVNFYSSPINWEDWGEYENNLTADKIVAYIRKEMRSNIDSIRVSKMILNGIVYTDSIPEVKLTSLIGIPKITVSNVIITQEEV